MGNVLSHHATNTVDPFVLRLARTIDSVLRTVNRKLSSVSSFFFSRVFGYDVVFTGDEHSDCTRGMRADAVVCGPGNVCIIPASRVQQREREKKRRSERRKRAEAAALGHRYAKVDSVPSSPVREKMIESLGEVAKAPMPRPEAERQTAAERDRGRLWVMGNVATSATTTFPVHGATGKEKERGDAASSPPSPVAVRITPRRSSNPPHLVSNSAAARARIVPVVEKDETQGRAGFDGGHLTRKKLPQPLHAPQALRLPSGALSLGPSPWEPAFRHPFSTDHERVAPTLDAMTSKAKHQLLQQVRPKLSLDTHLESSPLPLSTAAFVPSPLSQDDEQDQESFAILTAGMTISRPPSTASNHRSRTPAGRLARRSIDAISLRSSIDHSLPAPGAVIDVKTLATKAVKEEKGRKVWKDQVDKVALHKCLLQQQQADPAQAGPAGRRFSTATIGDKALLCVRTHEAD